MAIPKLRDGKTFSINRAARAGAKIKRKLIWPGHPPLTEEALAKLQSAIDGKEVSRGKTKRTICAVCREPGCNYPERIELED